MRPHLKRAFAPMIVAIESEAVAPHVEALREADQLLGDLAGADPSSAWGPGVRADLVDRAEAAHRRLATLLAQT